MKIIFKNILCSIIISSMLISVSCGNNSERISNSESNSENLKNSSETLESAETEPLHYAADVPESDFKGYAFTFLVRGNEAGDWGNYDICAEEINGEPVNDAVFNRNLAIEERYNVVISEYRTANNLLDTAKKGINAQDGSFDVIISSFWDAASLATDGYLHNLKEVEGIDLSQPWWDQRANEDLSIGNKLLFSVNDISILAAESTVDVYLFNKKMIGDFGLENPYDMVKNGTWTYDNMMSMMKGVASDLNGDGVMDENDRWGMANNGEGVLNSIFASAQQSYIKKDDKDIPYIAINNETALRAFEKTVTLMYNNPDVLDDATVMDKIFTDGKSLFHNQCLQVVKRFRQMDTDFGILPNPKFDESIKEYYHGVHPIGGAFSMPVTLTGDDLNRAAIVTEVLAAESKNTLIPAYYDVNLTFKLLRDEESVGMLDIILSTRSYDLIRPYQWGGLSDGFNALIKKGETSFVSTYEKLESATLKSMENTVNRILEN